MRKGQKRRVVVESGKENDQTKPKEGLKSEYFRWVLAHDHR